MRSLFEQLAQLLEPGVGGAFLRREVEQALPDVLRERKREWHDLRRTEARTAEVDGRGGGDDCRLAIPQDFSERGDTSGVPLPDSCLSKENFPDKKMPRAICDDNAAVLLAGIRAGVNIEDGPVIMNLDYRKGATGFSVGLRHAWICRQSSTVDIRQASHATDRILPVVLMSVDEQPAPMLFRQLQQSTAIVIPSILPARADNRMNEVSARVGYCPMRHEHDMADSRIRRGQRHFPLDESKSLIGNLRS